MTFPIELDPYVQLSLDGHWRHPLLDESILPEDPLHMALSAWKAGNVPSFDIQSKFAKDDIKGVFLFGYNEPSLDLSLLERVAVLRQNNLPVALNTNGSGFAPKLTDALASSAASIVERFQDSPFDVQAYPTMNRAGLVPEAGKAYNHERLMGYDCMGSRAVEHIQIDAEGNVILCCQDYHSEARMGHWQQPGDMMRVLSSDRARDLRNLVHGVVEAPDDFLCRKCEFALVEKPVE